MHSISMRKFWKALSAVMLVALPAFGAAGPSGACLDPVKTANPVVEMPSDQLPQPARDWRMARPFQKLLEVMNSSYDPKVVLDKILQNNLREDTFLLEALGRLYENSPVLDKAERKMVRKFTDRIEALEDILGDYNDSVRYLQEAIEIQAPQPLIEWLRGHNEWERQQFASVLERDGWLLSDPRNLGLFSKISKTLSKLDTREDDNALLELIADYLTGDSKKIFDILSVEVGVHPLRRHLRWFMLMAQGTNGLIQMGEKGDEPVWTHPTLEESEVAKYLKWPIYGRQRKIVWIDKPLFVTVANMVDVLGIAKDTGQFVQIYTRGIMKSGLAGNLPAARKMAAELAAKRTDEATVDPAAVADDAQKFLQKHKVREKIASQLRRAIR